MRTYERRGRTRLAAGALITAGVLVAAACGGGGDEGDGGGGGSDEPITLTLDTFGNFGYEGLIEQYQSEHPNITIEPRNVERLDDYTPRLQQWIASGSGAGDVVAIEEGIILQYMAQPDQFVDLAEYGAAELEDNFIPWKWDAAVTEDGRILGLGTDIGSNALCYRHDLFDEAGLPSDRDEVSERLQTWDDFIEMGQEFQAAMGDDVKWVDGPNSTFNSIVMQEAGNGPGFTYFNREGELVVESNPVVQTAFQTVQDIADAGLSAGIRNLTPPWNAGFQESAFATTTCPAWMLGLIEDAAGPDLAGMWDVAEIPGDGGNWGGSWLFVPEQSDNPEAAAELAKFLTSPESQAAAFQEASTLPSSPEALRTEGVQNLQNEYFNDAPVGEIFATNALELQPVYLGTDNFNVRQVMEDALLAYEAGELGRQEAWQRAVQNAEREAR